MEYNRDLIDGISSRFGEDLTGKHAGFYRVLSWMYTIITEPENAEELLSIPYKPNTPMGYLIDILTSGDDEKIG